MPHTICACLEAILNFLLWFEKRGCMACEDYKESEQSDKGLCCLQYWWIVGANFKRLQSDCLYPYG